MKFTRPLFQDMALPALCLGATLFVPFGHAAEPAAIDLLADHSLAQWTTPAGQPVSTGWKVQAGVLHRESRGGDIITKADFKNFELSWEWKISSGGNSGLKYKVSQFGQSWLGLEYQLLDDDKHPDARSGAGKRKSAAVYDLYPCYHQSKLLPVGEWNTSKVIVRGPKVEHWLNGALVVDFEIGSHLWDQAHASSKFAQIKEFARPDRGKILIQDHGDEVWFRHLQVHILPD